MSFNIVNLVKDQIQDQLLGQIGGLLGDEGNKASGAIDSMIPGILSGLSGSANKPGGADSLFSAVQDQDDSLLDNLGSLLGGGQAASVIENGNGVLNGLLGAGGLGKLAGVLSAFSGISKGGTSSLMGILAPIIIGAIKRKVMGDGLNAGSLANLLGGQSSNIAAAMPQGFADQLSSSGLLSSFGDSVSDVASGAAGMASGAVGAVGDAASGVGDGISSAASSVTGAVGDAAGDLKDGAANVAGSVSGAVGDAAGGLRDGAANVAGSVTDTAGNVADSVGDGVKQGGSMFRWLLPLAVLAGLAWLAFKFLLGGGIDNTVDTAADVTDSATAVVSETANATTEAASSAASTATEAASDAVDKVADSASDAVSSATDAVADAVDIDPSAIGEQVTGLFSGATDTLTGITDADSATAALPAIGELGSKVDSVSELFQKVPEAARGPISDITQKGMGALEPIFNKTMGLPGVGDIIGDTMGPIMEKLQELSS